MYMHNPISFVVLLERTSILLYVFDFSLQLFFQGSTTNEKINAFRYAHFSKLGGLSPFK